MAETGNGHTGRVRLEIRQMAYKSARDSICETSSLRGAAALKTAKNAVDAAVPHIRAEYVQQLGAVTAAQAAAAAAVAVVTLAADLAVFATIAARGPRRLRPVVAACMAGHTALVLFGRLKARRLRSAAHHDDDGGSAHG